MPKKRKAVDARQDDKGNIGQIRLEGNKKFTPVDTVIKMAKKGEVDLVVVNRGGKEHLRTPPDSQKGNNLDSMADD